MQQTNTRKPAAEATIDEERLHRKQRLAAAFRLWAKLGYDEGPAGHITARDPELLDHFWVNPFGRHFSMISVSDLLLVNHHGDVVEGNDVVNRAAFAIHSQIHAARPDVDLGRALPLDARQGVVVARPHARPDHAGRVRVLRRPRALRRLHGRRARHRGGQAHRARARRGEGGDPPEPRAAHRRRDRRRGGVVVHHDGPQRARRSCSPRQSASRC